LEKEKRKKTKYKDTMLKKYVLIACVMLGNLVVGSDETPTKKINNNGRRVTRAYLREKQRKEQDRLLKVLDAKRKKDREAAAKRAARARRRERKRIEKLVSLGLLPQSESVAGTARKLTFED